MFILRNVFSYILLYIILLTLSINSYALSPANEFCSPPVLQPHLRLDKCIIVQVDPMPVGGTTRTVWYQYLVFSDLNPPHFPSQPLGTPIFFGWEDPAADPNSNIPNYPNNPPIPFDIKDYYRQLAEQSRRGAENLERSICGSRMRVQVDITNESSLCAAYYYLKDWSPSTLNAVNFVDFLRNVLDLMFGGGPQNQILNRINQMMLLALATARANLDMADTYNQLANDPPDFNYRELAFFTDNNIPIDFGANIVVGNHTSQLLTAYANYLQSLKNSLKSIERFQGAILDGNIDYAALQYTFYEYYSSDAEEYKLEALNLVRSLPSLLTTEGYEDITYYPELLITLQSDLLLSGQLPQDLLDYFTSLGVTLSSQESQGIIDSILSIDSSIETPTSLFSLLTTFTSGLDMLFQSEAGPDLVGEPGDVLIIDGSATAMHGNAVNIAWRQLTGTTAQLTATETLQPSVVIPTNVANNEILTFELSIRDSAGNISSDIVNITVISTNNPPIANAGQDQTTRINTIVNLDASNSFDVDGDTLQFTWNQISGVQVTLQNTTTALPSFLAPDIESTLEFEVVVTDGQLTALDTVIVNSIRLNQIPTANAGPDITVYAGTDVTLDGTASSDPDMDSLIYMWSQIDGPSVTLLQENNGYVSFITPSDETTLTFELVVYDGNQYSLADTVEIHIRQSGSIPICAHAFPSKPILEKSDNKFKVVEVKGVHFTKIPYKNDQEFEDEHIQIKITNITQDEQQNDVNQRSNIENAKIITKQKVEDWGEIYVDSALLRSISNQHGNGRVYKIYFTATNAITGTQCSNNILVCVPAKKDSKKCTTNENEYLSLNNM